MKYSYIVKEEGTDKEETMEAMSLHKLIKKLDPKKTFRVEYETRSLMIVLNLFLMVLIKSYEMFLL